MLRLRSQQQPPLQAWIYMVCTNSSSPCHCVHRSRLFCMVHTCDSSRRGCWSALTFLPQE
jgi:hypothetical protein